MARPIAASPTYHAASLGRAVGPDQLHSVTWILGTITPRRRVRLLTTSGADPVSSVPACPAATARTPPAAFRATSGTPSAGGRAAGPRCARPPRHLSGRGRIAVP